MFHVCDSNLAIISTWTYLSQAKSVAKELSRDWKQVFFVCDHQGLVIAGFGG